MKQHGTLSPPAPRLAPHHSLPAFLRRFLPPLLFFLIAFGIDMLTGQRYSSVWGSTAILASVLSLFPAIRATGAAVSTYAAIWIGFNLVRAVADDLQLSIAGTRTVSSLEKTIFGGRFPSAMLQQAFFNPNHPRFHDLFLAAVHASFFVVPFAVALLVLWRAKAWFPQLTLATAITFALGLLGFVALPTAPPWIAAPETVTRITARLLPAATGVSMTGEDAGTPPGGFSFEPNHLAAMPSVHVAATVLVFLLSARISRLAAMCGLAYALSMTIAVVYLGEHFVLDAVGGWIIALAGWFGARLLLPALTRRKANTPTPPPKEAA